MEAIVRSTSTLARCGLALGGAALCTSLAACTQLAVPGQSPSPTPTASAGAVATDPFSLRVGDCIDDGLGEGEVVQVPVVDCAREHSAEAYHSEKLPDGEYPGLEQVKKDAVEVCLNSFEDFAGISYDDSQQLDFAWYYPTAGSWSTGDREVLCLMMKIDPETGLTVPTKGTLRDFGE
jgi:hypothetical protein